MHLTRYLSKIIGKNEFAHAGFFKQHCGRSRGDWTHHEKHDRKVNKMKNEKLLETSYQGEILYGIHPVYLALKMQKRMCFQLFLKTNFMVDEDFSKKDLKLEIEYLARKVGVDVKKVNTRHLNKLVPNCVHQLGVCLDASPIPMMVCDDTNFEESAQHSSSPLWVVLDSIQDPMNFGAVIRSSYFFGVNRIITVRSNSCKLSPTVSKASAGAMEVVDMFCVADLKDFIQRKKLDGWSIVSTAPCYNSRSAANCNIVELNKFLLRGPTILILGNEGRGVSSDIENFCDVMLSIHPKGDDVFPHIDSLNVSVATGIILHHFKNSCDIGLDDHQHSY